MVYFPLLPRRGRGVGARRIKDVRLISDRGEEFPRGAPHFHFSGVFSGFFTELSEDAFFLLLHKIKVRIFFQNAIERHSLGQEYKRAQLRLFFNSRNTGKSLAKNRRYARIQAERKFKKMTIRRGDIFYADLSPVIGSEQGGLRPVLIVQNDVGNRYSPTVIAAAITSRMGKTKLPTHIDVSAPDVGLAKDSVILLEQIRTLDKQRLKEKMGHLDDATMRVVNNAIQVSFGLTGGSVIG